MIPACQMQNQLVIEKKMLEELMLTKLPAAPVVAAVVALKSTGTQARAKERVKEEKAIESVVKLFFVFHH
jgi:hypothetical protein